MPSGELNIPVSHADIHPAWLAAALSQRWPGVVVSDLEVETIHDGTAFTCRIRPTYRADGPAGPPTVCLKAGMDAPHRDVIFKAGLCTKEAMVYRDVLPAIGARVADCLASGYEAETGKGFVLLEDLDAAGATFCGAEKPLTVDQVASGLTELAKLHAHFWRAPQLEEPRWRHRGRSLGEKDPLEALFLSYLPDTVKTPHGGAVAHMFHDPKTMGDAVARLRSLDHGVAHCLIHGDAHLGNFYLDATGAPGMADFQCVQRGHCTHDIAMFVASALDVVDRRRHER